jgi:hypothetical protein
LSAEADTTVEPETDSEESEITLEPFEPDIQEPVIIEQPPIVPDIETVEPDARKNQSNQQLNLI